MSLRKLGAIVTWLGGWPAIILLVYGIPGSVDDAGAWYKVINVISNWPILAASIGLVATGPILWTSDWWWTRVVSFAKGRFRESTECSMGMVKDRELEQFRECLPHIKRCRKLIRPYGRDDWECQHRTTSIQ